MTLFRAICLLRGPAQLGLPEEAQQALPCCHYSLASYFPFKKAKRDYLVSFFFHNVVI